MLLRAWLIGMAPWLILGQVTPGPVPDQLTGPIGTVVSTATVVAFCTWRLKHQDAEARRKDELLQQVQTTMIEMVVPALRDTANAQNEVRGALASMLEQSRRGEYDLVRRWDEWAARRERGP